MVDMSDRPLADGFEVALLADTPAVTNEDVLALWAAGGAVPADEALRRVHEVVCVATRDGAEAVGVSTAALRRVPSFGADFWCVRVFVADDARLGYVAMQLLHQTRLHLTDRHESGADTRAVGVLIDVQNDGLVARRTRAVWRRMQMTYVGDSQDGGHVRVHYFPGARIPPPN